MIKFLKAFVLTCLASYNIYLLSLVSLNMSEKELGKTSKQVCLVVPVRIFSRIDVMAGVDVWLDYFRP